MTTKVGLGKKKKIKKVTCLSFRFEKPDAVVSLVVWAAVQYVQGASLLCTIRPPYGMKAAKFIS